MADIDYSKLQQCIDTTFGRSALNPATNTHCLKISILGANRLLLNYMILTRFDTHKGYNEMEKMCFEEAKDIIKSAVVKLKKDYKELTGSNLKMKALHEPQNDIEIINRNAFLIPLRQGYFRSRVIFSVE